MLSICTLKSAASAGKYYTSGDYYISSDGLKNQWYGATARMLNLQGGFKEQDFKQLLSGVLPDGTTMHKGFNKKGEETHRPGYDLTFSAPKSISIMALVADDKRLVKAHDEAVKETLDKVEQQYAATRVKKNGVVSRVETKNLLAALFTHIDSRELDSQLHTHSVILNITKNQDKFRAIFGDDFYNHKMKIGMQYRTTLAKKAQELGYHIKTTHSDNRFELRDVPQELIDVFSTRTKQISEKLAEWGKERIAKVASFANTHTRAVKKKSIKMR